MIPEQLMRRKMRAIQIVWRLSSSWAAMIGPMSRPTKITKPGVPPFASGGGGAVGIGETREVSARRCKPPVYLEGVGPLAVRDLSPGERLRTGDLFQVEFRTVAQADPRGIAVGHDLPPDVGDDQVIDIGLLGRLHEELLELKASPAHAESRPRARLEGADKGRPFLHEEARGLFPLPVDVFQGREDEERYDDRDRADDQPGGDHRPEPPLSSRFLPVHSASSMRPCRRRPSGHPLFLAIGYLLANWIPRMDTYHPVFSFWQRSPAAVSRVLRKTCVISV